MSLLVSLLLLVQLWIASKSHITPRLHSAIAQTPPIEGVRPPTDQVVGRVLRGDREEKVLMALLAGSPRAVLGSMVTGMARHGMLMVLIPPAVRFDPDRGTGCLGASGDPTVIMIQAGETHRECR